MRETRSVIAATLFLTCMMTLAPASAPGSGADLPSQRAEKRMKVGFGNLPLSFEVNQGQTDPRVKFLARAGGYSLYLASDEAILSLRRSTQEGDTGDPHGKEGSVRSSILRMRLIGASRDTRVSGLEQLPGRTNYFIGNDPKKWHANVPTYAKVRYQDIYPGIDLLYYGNGGQLENDFMIAPGADPRAIRIAFSGDDQIHINAAGDLVVRLGSDELLLRKPLIYQTVDGSRREIAGGYALQAPHTVGFVAAGYDPSQPLVVDPQLIYSTFLSSTSISGYGVTADAAGNAYFVGQAITIPTTPGAFQTVNPNVTNIFSGFVAKMNPTGTALIYSTYLGGSHGDNSNDSVYAIAVDTTGNAYVTGTTDSTDFPITPGAFQATNISNPTSAYVTKLNPAGTALVYSTYLGGGAEQRARGIAVDNAGSAYVTGFTNSGVGTVSASFPTTPGAFQTTLGGNAYTAYVSKLNSAGTALIYSTYLGGSGQFGDFGSGITIDAAGNAYVTGTTSSSNFPTTPGALQTAWGGGDNGFVTKLNPTGTALVYSTFIGGNSSGGANTFIGDDGGYQNGNGIAIDSAGNAYVAGYTASTNFPTTPGASQTTYGGGAFDGFVSKLNPAGKALVYSTFLGGSAQDRAWGIAVDAAGNAYVTGDTASTNFPTTPGAFQAGFGGGFSGNPNSGDAFMAKLNPAGSALIYSTYLGGGATDVGYTIAVNRSVNAYVTGGTGSTNFPTTAGAFQTTGPGVFLTDISFPVATPTVSGAPNPSVVGQTVSFTITVTPNSPSTNTPSGTVTLLDGANIIGSGSLNNAGQATVPAAFATVGSHSITAQYIGDTNFASGGPSSVFVQTVNKAATSASVGSSLNPSASGQAVVFTATVTVTAPGAGTPTGTVTFFDGAAQLGTGALSSMGLATFQTSTLSAGPHSITAHYAGDTNFNGGVSAVLTQSVSSTPDFTFVASLPSVSITSPGASSSPVTLTITAQNGYNGTVAFAPSSCSISPAGSLSSCSFSSASLTGSGSTQVTINTTAPRTAMSLPGNRLTSPNWTMLILGAGLTLMLLLGFPANRGRRGVVLGACAVVVLVACVGCSSGGNSVATPTTIPGTPTGVTYTATVAATANGGQPTHTTSFTFSVQ